MSAVGEWTYALSLCQLLATVPACRTSSGQRSGMLPFDRAELLQHFVVDFDG